jgi:hypothetical protein
MPALLGSYAMTREASGTSWQPDSSAVQGLHFRAGDWSLMAQGEITGIHDHQGGPRGDSMTFSQSMVMLMGTRPAGEDGRIGLRAMLSLDALMGKRGYPLLLATGETPDGLTHLVDRQHPHDLFMELAASYAHELDDVGTVSLYAGLPGEPALGPPAFMHRISGMDNPEAPIGHHWFDSTHVTFGVVTIGFARQNWKIEASAFNGREPDQNRYDFETPRLDSWALRLSFNPSANWSMQASTGRLHSPEGLEPDRNEHRTTFSVTHVRPLTDEDYWASTLAYSIKKLQLGPALHGFLAETTLHFAQRNRVFARLEAKEDNELSHHAGADYVGKLSLGYSRSLPLGRMVQLDLGGLVSAYALPAGLRHDYGGGGIKSVMIFGRLRLGQ